MPTRWEDRERRLRKRRGDDMLVSGRSTKTVLLQVLAKRACQHGNTEHGVCHDCGENFK